MRNASDSSVRCFRQLSSAITTAVFVIRFTAVVASTSRNNKNVMTKPQMNSGCRRAVFAEYVAAGQISCAACEEAFWILRNVTLVLVSGKTDHSSCGTIKTASGKRIMLTIARTHNACRTAAERRRSSMDKAATLIKIRVGLTITSSAKFISCLLYEPCRSILAAGLVLHQKA